MPAVHENFCMELLVQQIKGFKVCSDSVLLPVQFFFFTWASILWIHSH